MSRTNRIRRAAVLLAAPAALALASGARAEVAVRAELHGFVNAELERVWTRGSAVPYEPRFRLTDGNSRLSFSGSVGLAESTRALWQLEGSLGGFEQGGVNDRGLPSSIVSRNSWIGLTDDRFGTLLLGNQESAYRSLVGSASELGGNLGLTSLGLDLWNNTSAQLSGNPWSVFGRGEARYRNSLHYLSPEWIARVAASYGLDEAVADGRRRDRWSVAARCKLAGFQLGVGYDQQYHTGVDTDALRDGLGLRTGPADDASTSFLKVLASYALPTGTYLGAGLEWSRYGYSEVVPPSGSEIYPVVRTGTMKQAGGMVSVAQPLGDATLMASAGRLWSLGGALHAPGADFRATQLSIGARYVFSPSFGAYAYYTHVRNNARADVNLGQAPLYTNALGTADAYLAPAASPRALGVGAIARF